MPEIEKAGKTGFCFGVKRAIDILEKVARERGEVETLGAVVHNQQVLQRLAGIGVSVVKDSADIKGDTIVTSSHGISPDLEASLRARNLEIVSTTCHERRRKAGRVRFFRNCLRRCQSPRGQRHPRLGEGERNSHH
jgi:4-hydroxy-3-methylbut-2-enyl diphosphate reductase IspH